MEIVAAVEVLEDDLPLFVSSTGDDDTVRLEFDGWVFVVRRGDLFRALKATAT